ncbi:hypothetical protein U14_06000 [Candidatus Moduliflexus flocculans]|uniref:Uncharacterized protein n=1 Tax=Candidatus Moduliflexus flocculans TaxID=1499966 RepID=A0A081BTI1_9BACT|nr:hypothetical protein U14_06000 [Candidatus Moduliflexus flocculans]
MLKQQFGMSDERFACAVGAAMFEVMVNNAGLRVVAGIQIDDAPFRRGDKPHRHEIHPVRQERFQGEEMHRLRDIPHDVFADVPQAEIDVQRLAPDIRRAAFETGGRDNHVPWQFFRRRFQSRRKIDRVS